MNSNDSLRLPPPAQYAGRSAGHQHLRRLWRTRPALPGRVYAADTRDRDRSQGCRSHVGTRVLPLGSIWRYSADMPEWASNRQHPWGDLMADWAFLLCMYVGYVRRGGGLSADLEKSHSTFEYWSMRRSTAQVSTLHCASQSGTWRGTWTLWKIVQAQRLNEGGRGSLYLCLRGERKLLALKALCVASKLAVAMAAHCAR